MDFIPPPPVKQLSVHLNARRVNTLQPERAPARVALQGRYRRQEHQFVLIVLLARKVIQTTLNVRHALMADILLDRHFVTCVPLAKFQLCHGYFVVIVAPATTRMRGKVFAFLAKAAVTPRSR